MFPWTLSAYTQKYYGMRKGHYQDISIVDSDMFLLLFNWLSLLESLAASTFRFLLSDDKNELSDSSVFAFSSFSFSNKASIALGTCDR